MATRQTSLSSMNYWGKPLEIEFVQDRKFWAQYFLIEDEGTIQTLEERFQALKSAPPLKASGGNR
jgi:hypothetical protein